MHPPGYPIKKPKLNLLVGAVLLVFKSFNFVTQHLNKTPLLSDHCLFHIQSLLSLFDLSVHHSGSSTTGFANKAGTGCHGGRTGLEGGQTGWVGWLFWGWLEAVRAGLLQTRTLQCSAANPSLDFSHEISDRNVANSR